jgi:hypothetical protein
VRPIEAAVKLIVDDKRRVEAAAEKLNGVYGYTVSETSFLIKKIGLG